jgi:hypothetical protein
MMAICSYNDDGWRGEICLAVNHDRPVWRLRAGGSALFLMWLFKKTSGGKPSRRWLAISWAHFCCATPRSGASGRKYPANRGAIAPNIVQMRLEYRANETQIKRE